MSSGKCPCCGSKDVSGVCCNICGTPLMFFDNENKRPVTAVEARTIKETHSKEVSDRIKDMDGVNATPSISKDDIVREILEKSKVNTPSPVEENIAVDEGVKEDASESEVEVSASSMTADEVTPEKDTEEETSDTKEFSFDFSDANKSFVELGRELKLLKKTQDAELKTAICEDNAEDVSEEDDFENKEDADVTEDVAVAQEVITEVPEDVSEDATDKCPEESILSENDDIVSSDEAIKDDNVQVCEDKVSGDTIIVSPVTEDSLTQDSSSADALHKESLAENEEVKQDDVHTDEKAQMVDKISQAVSSQMETDEDCAPGNPQWKDIEKMQTADEDKEDNNYFYVTKPTLLLKVCRWVLASLMLITIVCMFLPYTKIGGLSDEHDIQLFAIISVIPYVVGVFLSVFERAYIRKYIYSLFANVLFLGLYMMFMFKYPIESIRDIVYPVLCSLMMLVSVVGVVADRSPRLKKANSWFDSFVYIYMFINLFIIFLIAVVMFLLPDAINADIRSYLYKLLVILIFGVVSSVLILKRFLLGTDIMLLTSIAFIVTNIMTYNSIMAANSFNFTVDLPYMHYVGFIISCITAVCTLFPIVMFFWMRFLKKRTPVRKKIKNVKEEVVQ